jgi:hypothetical protein
MSKILPRTTTPTQLAKDAQMEADRMQDVVLLLQRLSEHDEATLRLIMDCLYDIGSVHWANQHLPNPALNHLMRGVARMSKPVFRVFAVKWFQKYCPQMIADWLYTVATFQTQTNSDAAPPAPIEVIEVMQQLEASRQQVKALQTKLKCMTGVVVGLVLILGGALVSSGNFIPSALAEFTEVTRSLRPVKLEFADQPGN